MLKVDENLLRAFWKLFYLQFLSKVTSERTLCTKDFTILCKNKENFISYKLS